MLGGIKLWRDHIRATVSKQSGLCKMKDRMEVTVIVPRHEVLARVALLLYACMLCDEDGASETAGKWRLGVHG